MNIFDEGIVESKTERFQTRKFSELDHIFPGVLKRIARVTAIILNNYINQSEWDLIIVEGSVTIQHKKNNSRVIKVFIDDSGDIFNKIPHWTDDHAIIVGVELTTEDPFTKKLIRDNLRSTFGCNYIDPVNNNKTYLAPQLEHLYDLVVLGNGVCPYDVSQELVNEIFTKIVNEFPN